MDYDKEEIDRKLREADDVKFFCSKEGWSEGAISKDDRESFTYSAVKNLSKEIMNKSYFDLHPLKSISRQEAEAIYPPREGYPFEPLEFKPMIDDAVIFGVGLSVCEVKNDCITVTQLKPEDVLIKGDNDE
jgi:hypothetical protein